MKMKYEVEADWILLKTCNFRCTYCLCGQASLSSKLVTYGTHQQWVDAFRATGKIWLLHITGGEPGIYPDFLGLCENLSKGHYLSINSNLSNPSIIHFAERMNPERVHYINAALHPDERQKKSSYDIFIKHVQKLQQHHFNVLVSTVMTPPMVKEFPNLSERFASEGVFLLPKVMRGEYLGNKYPESYAEGERALILEHMINAAAQYSPVIERMGEAATIDMFADRRFLDKIPDYRGRLCGSGYNFVTIKPDGQVIRCGSGKVLGNLLSKDVKFLRSPIACDTSYCPYFCEKYTSPELTQVSKNSEHPFIASLSSLAKRVLKFQS